MYTLGAVGGSLSVVGWGLFNCYSTVIQGNFRQVHPSCHSIGDMAGVVGGPWLRELTSVLFVICCKYSLSENFQI